MTPDPIMEEMDRQIFENLDCARALLEAGWWYPDEPTHARIYNAALPEPCRMRYAYPHKVYNWRTHAWFKSPIERMPDMTILHRIVLHLSIRRKTSMTRAALWAFAPENEALVAGMYALEALR